MKKRQLLVSIIAGLLAAVMVFGLIAMAVPTADAAKTSAEIQQEIEALKKEHKKNKEKLNALKDQLAGNQTEINQLVAKKNAIDQEVFLLNQQVQNLSQQITAYNGLIADKQAELDTATARWDELSQQYKARVRAMEENGSVSYWSVLFQANSLSDLLDRLNMIEEIAAADQRRMKELNEAAKEVSEAKNGLESEKIALEASKKELEEASQQMEDSRLAAEELLQTLIAKGQAYQALIDEHEKIESESLRELSAAETAYDKAREKEYLEWLAAQKPPANTSGTTVDASGKVWLMPINYTHFSSPFGWRIHPIYGDTRFHAGVDLSAPTGTPIVATRAGVVTTTAYEAGGAGYFVNINHLDGFVTRYMHMTHFVVVEGQTVKAGQVIGYCGSTGASTGPHLHFGVYYNGSAVNPAQYINIR
ncbi:MAG: peptidoglycan DD-metalloendopeptidase family protein [Oscillospiraceae bacterium]|nr:peptidoglycan DD-metalloendopeptidase family protein [Oscillospiraceae bacterium]